MKVMANKTVVNLKTRTNALGLYKEGGNLNRIRFQEKTTRIFVKKIFGPRYVIFYKE